MKKITLTIGTDSPTVYVKPHSSIPALLWGEIVKVLEEYQKFEHNITGTRFDTWLKKS